MKGCKRSIARLNLMVVFMLISVVIVQGQEAEKPSLYKRLGGVYNIAAVVDDFIDRLFTNDILNANPAISGARNPVRAAGLKFHVTAMVCQATGGAEKYTGLSMLDTHKDMNISKNEWQAMVIELKKTLDKFKVPAQEQDEILAIVESTKPDIVVSKK